MKDVCVECNRKAYCMEPCELWPIQASLGSMKILMKPIEMIAWFTKEGVPNPLRYKLDGLVCKVGQVTSKSEEKLAGNRMIIYKCQSEINGALRPFELKYELQTCRWFLWKM